jgi:hypothetical protein
MIADEVLSSVMSLQATARTYVHVQGSLPQCPAEPWRNSARETCHCIDMSASVLRLHAHGRHRISMWGPLATHGQQQNAQKQQLNTGHIQATKRRGSCTPDRLQAAAAAQCTDVATVSIMLLLSELGSSRCGMLMM